MSPPSLPVAIGATGGLSDFTVPGECLGRDGSERGAARMHVAVRQVTHLCSGDSEWIVEHDETMRGVRPQALSMYFLL